MIAIPFALLIVGIAWFGGIYFKLLIGAITLITVWEVHRIMSLAGKADYFPVSIFIAGTIWSVLFLPKILSLSLVLLVLAVTVYALIRRETDFSGRWMSTLFTGVYAPAGFLMMIYLRELGEPVDGFWLTMTLFLMIWGNDIFAYFGGKTFGKRALAPTISPKKTWEGFYWGFLGAAVGYMIVFITAATFPLPFWALFPSVLIISLLGPLGDISASSLKRKAEMKDSSSILPGHGGLFDRFDSMILSAPFIFFFFNYLV